MNVYHDIPLRSSRDRMIDLLFEKTVSGPALTGNRFTPNLQMLANILRDLPILYSSTVTDGSSTVFYVLGAQENTDYILCDEQYTPLMANGKEITGTPEDLNYDSDELFYNLRSCRIISAETVTEIKVPEAEDKADISDFARNWKRVVQINSPVIESDQNFHILARKRFLTAGVATIEEYLHQAISVRVGIDTTLAVLFVAYPTDLLSERGDTISIDYNQPVVHTDRPLRVRILQSQEGVSYQLFERTAGESIERSDIVIGGEQGNEGDMNIVLTATGAFEEDTDLFVLAFRDDGNKDNTNPLMAGELDQKLKVIVRPNTDLAITLETPTISYDGTGLITVSGIQKTADYQLFGRQLELLEYSPAGALEIEDVKSIRDLNPIGGPKSGSQGGTLSFDTSAQKEDSVFVVQAIKNDRENGETVRLKTGLVLLVEPSPSPVVATENNEVSNGEEGLVVLNETQRGVKYQLFQDGSPVNYPGYDVTDRAIGITDLVKGSVTERREFGMRIGIDFKIGTGQESAIGLFGGGTLNLPTGPLFQTSRFKVLATKSYTGLQTELTADAEFDVGVDPTLDVRFLPQLDSDELSEDGKILTINPNSSRAQNHPLKITIFNSQEGVSYQCFEIAESGRIERSGVVAGAAQSATGNSHIELKTTGLFDKDIAIVIRAFRDVNDKDSADPQIAVDLNQRLSIIVPINPDLEVSLAQKAVAYEGSSLITVKGIQPSVEYQLLSRPLGLFEYLPNGDLEFEGVENTQNLEPFGDPKSGGKGDSLTFETGAQKEDALFVVRASKTNGSVSLRIKTPLTLLVFPSPDAVASLPSDTILPGEKAIVILKETQFGVKYRLMVGGTAAGEFGYHISERAIGGDDQRREFGMRVETDFKIGTAEDTPDTLFAQENRKYGKDALILPAGPLQETTTFKVLAKKTYTGLETELTEGVTITVENST